MQFRRAFVATGVALTLALSSVGVAGASAAPTSDSRDAVAKAGTTGRFITTSKKGIVLVDENGARKKTLIREKRADLVDVHSDTGVFLYSTGKGKKTWHIANLFGADLGEFTLPKNASVPATDNGGYEAYWVRPGSATANAAVMALEINDPQAEPRVVRDLVPGTATGISVSPDFQWLAVVLAGQVHLVSTDGATLRTVPRTAPTASVYSERAVFSPDSGRVAYLSGTAPAPVNSPYVAPVAGDYAPVATGSAYPVLYDWAPVGDTLLVGATGGPFSGISATTGAVTASYPVTSDDSVFWSGLAAGAFPRDKTRPKLRIDKPKANTVKSWSTVSGSAADQGGSLLRYVIFRAFQKRGNAWWGLVGNGKRPTWKKFPNRIEAKLFAKERRAKITGDDWSLGIPGMRTGRLVLVVKAADGAGNNNTRTISVDVR